VGAPASSLGTDGDFYIDAMAYLIYGPKAGGSWPMGFSLIVSPGTPANTSTLNYSDGEVPAGTIDGSNVTFRVAQPPFPQLSLQLAKNGDILQAGDDYELVGNTITFINGALPSPGDTLLAFYRYAGSGAAYSYSDDEVPQGAINGTNLAFTLNHPPVGNSLQLVKNGSIQALGSDYTLTGSLITFLSGSVPQSGDLIECWYRY
jgi:hypothetical protein